MESMESTAEFSHESTHIEYFFLLWSPKIIHSVVRKRENKTFTFINLKWQQYNRHGGLVRIRAGYVVTSVETSYFGQSEWMYVRRIVTVNQKHT